MGRGIFANISAIQRESFRLVELAGDGQHRVIGLVILLIERVQALDRHVLDIGAAADGAAAIRVERVGGLEDALVEDAVGTVLAHFELVADHRHLGVEQRLFDLHAGHALGFEPQRPLEIGVARGDGFVVVGAVVGGGAVEIGAVVGELLLDVAAGLGLLEQHVLEQVRHAGLAVTLVPGADEVGHVDRHLRLGVVGKQEDVQPVREGVLGRCPRPRSLW